MSRFVFPLALLVFLLPQRVQSRSPAPRSCPKKTTTGLVRLMQRHFPGLSSLAGNGGCRWFGLTQQVSFTSFTIKGSHRTTFYVHDPMGLKEGVGDIHPAFSDRQRRKKERTALVPFQSKAQVQTTARRIEALPFIKKTLGTKQLFCSASTDAPGSTAYYHCSTKLVKTSSILMKLTGHRPGVILQQQLNLQGKPGGLEVYSWRFKAVTLPSDARRWRAARQNPRVKAFLKKHPHSWVSLESWHQDYLTLSPKNPKAAKMIIVFARRISWKETKTTPLLKICEGLPHYTCIGKANRENKAYYNRQRRRLFGR